MNRLQKYISDKLRAGMTLREMSRESGVSHTNLSRYHNQGKEPDSVNLTKLAHYFNVEFHDLLEPFDPRKPAFNLGPTLEDQLAYQEWQTLSPDQKLQAVQMLRRLKAENKTGDREK